MPSKEMLLQTSEARVKATAAKQIEKQGKLAWNKDENRAGLCRHVARLFDAELSDERIKALFADLDFKGFGVNASQFRQWLETDEVALLPKTDKAKALASSLLAE